MKYKILAASVAITLCTSFSTTITLASSHREAPAVTEKPKVDSTDFYMFNSYEANRSDYVTILANYIPLQDPQGGPNYFSMDPDALYEIHIDNNGDALEDITFQFRFKNRLTNNKGIMVPVGEGENQKNIPVALKHVAGISKDDQSALGFNETYSLSVMYGHRRYGNKHHIINPESGRYQFTKPYDNVGDKTFNNQQDYADYANQYIYNFQLPGCNQDAKVFVGQRKDSFAVNLGETFDLVNYVPIDGNSFPGGIQQNTDNDDLRNKNITTLALEIPKACLTGSGNDVIGGWTSASLRQVSILNPRSTFLRPEYNGGAWVQVSRLSAPLVNELVIGLKDKDRYSSSHPSHDGQFLDYVTHPSLPFLLDVLFNAPVNATLGTNIPNLAPTNIPRQDLVTTFLTGFPGVNQQQKVTPSEMTRLNTAIPAKVLSEQNSMGVIGDDLAGFPNGRRPGDDVVDIALRVVMGRLCHPIPVNGNDTDLNLCSADKAAVGTVPFTDGAPLSAVDFDSNFPYLRTPLAGSPN